VVTAADVRHSKPAPDVYLLALARLGVSARDAVAIEDTATGVAAARAAGLRCLAIPHEHSLNQDFSAATAVLKSMQEALQWLKNQDG
jgi:beta-phosphoglucomutase-like phosphatase (HAD superfamily)